MSAAHELRACADYVADATNAIEGADRGRELARLARKAAGDLEAYAKTMTLIEEIDARVVGVLSWLDERGRNSTSYGSHADAYEIAARRLREALGDGAARVRSEADDLRPGLNPNSSGDLSQ